MFGTNTHNEWQLRKSALGLRLQRAHCSLCLQVTSVFEWQKAATQLYQKRGECQPELILYSGSHCLCSTLITNSIHYADTSHLLHQRLMWQSGQQTGRSPSKEGNTTLHGFVAVAANISADHKIKAKGFTMQETLAHESYSFNFKVLLWLYKCFLAFLQKARQENWYPLSLSEW